MPPVIYKAPLPVRLKAPKGRIVPLDGPDIKIGKSLICACPQRIKESRLEEMKQALRKYLGKKKEHTINVHATYAVTKKADGTKMGQGKGLIEYFVARVPAGKTICHIPTVSPFVSLGFKDPIFYALKKAAAKLSVPCIFRAQNNLFRVYDINHISQKKKMADERKHFNAWKLRLFQKKL